MTTLHPGGCLCGKVRFEAAVEPLRIAHCHCIFCRRQTGGPVATFAGFKRSIEITWSRGAPAVY